MSSSHDWWRQKYFRPNLSRSLVQMLPADHAIVTWRSIILYSTPVFSMSRDITRRPFHQSAQLMGIVRQRLSGGCSLSRDAAGPRMSGVWMAPAPPRRTNGPPSPPCLLPDIVAASLIIHGPLHTHRGLVHVSVLAFQSTVQFPFFFASSNNWCVKYIPASSITLQRSCYIPDLFALPWYFLLLSSAAESATFLYCSRVPESTYTSPHLPSSLTSRVFKHHDFPVYLLPCFSYTLME